MESMSSSTPASGFHPTAVSQSSSAHHTTQGDNQGTAEAEQSRAQHAAELLAREAEASQGPVPLVSLAELVGAASSETTSVRTDELVEACMRRPPDVPELYAASQHITSLVSDNTRLYRHCGLCCKDLRSPETVDYRYMTHAGAENKVGASRCSLRPHRTHPRHDRHGHTTPHLTRDKHHHHKTSTKATTQHDNCGNNTLISQR